MFNVYLAFNILHLALGIVGSAGLKRSFLDTDLHWYDWWRDESRKKWTADLRFTTKFTKDTKAEEEVATNERESARMFWCKRMNGGDGPDYTR